MRVDSWIFEPEYEKIDRDELVKLQVERLRKQVEHCYKHSPIYREKFRDAGIEPQDIKSLDDLNKIPFTTKDDMRRAYPYGMLARSIDDVMEIHASSGTTGKPTTTFYSSIDLEIWGTVMARIYASAGTKKGDIIHNAYGYGLFTGGLGFHYGALKIGAAVVPLSAGGTERQLTLAKELGTTILCCTPTYAAYLGEYARTKLNMDPKKELKWKSGILGAEPWSEELRRRIEDSLGIEAFDIYGLSEIIGPGVSVECPEHNGLHVYEDHFLVEVINPETGEPVEEGEVGELVLTTLTRDAMPLLRFRTGDLTTWTTEECACGRTIGRMGRLLGRADDMVKVRGIKFWPKALEEAILSVDGLSNNFIVKIERPKILDILTIEIEPDEEVYRMVKGDLKKLEPLRRKLMDRVRNVIGITPNVVLKDIGSIERFMGKARRFIDLRKF
jgi:phenylacetate-CoA ligase